MLAKILVHGGAGLWRKKEEIRRGLIGVEAAASAGLRLLRNGGSALDAVEAAVSAMEDDPVFNAGRGSSLTVIGTVEMDAAIMDGRDLSAGAVTLVRRVRNPIRLARLVMQKTDHVLLAGGVADNLAEAFSLPKSNPITREKRRLLARLKKNCSDASLNWLQKNPKLLIEHPDIVEADTVGAVAMDENGDLAAGSSTGGVMMKMPGRIGDTPLIGAGLYADNLGGAATTTGIGEVAVKLALSKAVCSAMEGGLTAKAASIKCVRAASLRLKGRAGVIAINLRGRTAAVHNTPHMLWAYADVRTRKPKSAPRGKIVSLVR